MTIFNQSSAGSNNNNANNQDAPWRIEAEVLDATVVALADYGDYTSDKFKDANGKPKVSRKLAILFAVDELEDETGFRKTITTRPVTASTFVSAKPKAGSKRAAIVEMFATAGIDVANKKLSELIGLRVRLDIRESESGYQECQVKGAAKNKKPIDLDAAKIYVPAYWIDREKNGEQIKGKAVEIMAVPQVLKEVRPIEEDEAEDTASGINVQDVADSI